MPTATVVSAVLMAAAKKAPAKTTGSGIGEFIFIIVIFGLVYIFFLRPRTQAARRQRDTLMELSPGDEVLTGAGIYGTVLDVEPDRVTLETAPGTRITVVRSTVSRKIVEPDPGGSSVAEQNWQDEGHDGVAEAAGWHDPNEHDPDEDDNTDDHPADSGDDVATDKPEADGAPDAGQGGGR